MAIIWTTGEQIILSAQGCVLYTVGATTLLGPVQMLALGLNNSPGTKGVRTWDQMLLSVTHRPLTYRDSQV